MDINKYIEDFCNDKRNLNFIMSIQPDILKEIIHNNAHLSYWYYYRLKEFDVNNNSPELTYITEEKFYRNLLF